MQTTSSIQRRKHPRYNVRMGGIVSRKPHGGAVSDVTCTITDISRYGIKLVAPHPLAESGQVTVRLSLSDESSVTPGLRILREYRTNGGATEYAGEFIFSTEDTRRRLHSFLRTLGEENVRERRKGERRLRTVSHQPERRRTYRRREFGIFTDSMSFSDRALAWKASYTLFRRTESTQAARITVNGQELVSFGSNDYYGLSHDPRVKEAAIKALQRYGTTAGSRVLNGTLELHEELEKQLADFKQAESVLLFTGGYLANVAILTALLQENDIVFLDERAHASIIDGCVFSKAKLIPFRHNSVDDLKSKIRRVPHQRSLIIIDGVYSIEGNLARLPEICRLSKEERIPLMVDDAHGFGIMGETGSGTAEHFGLNGEVDLDIGMLGGALGGVGAFVACKKYIADYLRHFSRGFLFTTTLPPATTAALLESLRIIRTEKSLREKLFSNVDVMKRGLEELGYEISATESAIVSIFIGNEQTTYDMVRMLESSGIFVNAFIRPAVKRGKAKIRLTVTAAHSESDLRKTLEAFKKLKPEFDARMSAMPRDDGD